MFGLGGCAPAGAGGCAAACGGGEASAGGDGGASAGAGGCPAARRRRVGRRGRLPGGRRGRIGRRGRLSGGRRGRASGGAGGCPAPGGGGASGGAGGCRRPAAGRRIGRRRRGRLGGDHEISPDDAANPVAESGDPRVDAGKFRLAASHTDADHADLAPVGGVELRHQRTAAVALTGVMASFWRARAQHPRVDHRALDPLLHFGAFSDIDERDRAPCAIPTTQRSRDSPVVASCRRSRPNFPAASFFCWSHLVRPQPTTVTGRSAASSVLSPVTCNEMGVLGSGSASWSRAISFA